MSFHLSNWRKTYNSGEPLVTITAYDLMTARLAEACDPDLVLVGDSLGNVVQGRETTTPVTLDEMIYHTRLVRRNLPERFVIADMPFGSFKLDPGETVQNCVHVFKETDCDGVKLEGATAGNLRAIETLTEAGVPVFGHLGLQPQQVQVMGGFKRQGKTEEEADRLLDEARRLEEAGCFAIVLEAVEHDTAARITYQTEVATVGIGSGPSCDGQILVIHDVLGMLPEDPPPFVDKFAELFQAGAEGLERWGKAVRGGDFPRGAESGNGNRSDPEPASETGESDPETAPRD